MIIARRTYFVVFAALIAFTAITVTVSQINLGPFNAMAALAIAAFKAALVILYFMHARFTGRLIWVFIAAGLFWLLILMALAMSDVLTRGWLAPAG